MGTPRWTIRPATNADAPGLTAVMEAAYARYAERLGGQRLPPLDVDYAQEIANFPVWVAELSGKIVGGLVMVFTPDEATLANVAAAPEAQGTGLGRAFLELAETEARSRGYGELHLGTHPALPENVALYEHLGWREIERDAHHVRMKKRLE